ncbi:MAG: hypothetical protein H8D38_04680 [DPANN group archaeon]|nr:hypothetical protein [DPANN group archaeon]
MDDPGDSDERRMLEMFPKFIFLAAIMIIIIFFAYFFTINNLRTETIEREIFFNRIIYSTNALAYYDEDIGRTYLGRIDLEKLNTTNLEKSINYSNNYFFAARITLQGKDPVYYHKELWETLEPLAKAKIRGPGGADYRVKEFRASYIENGTLKSAPIKIEVIRARS